MTTKFLLNVIRVVSSFGLRMLWISPLAKHLPWFCSISVLLVGCSFEDAMSTCYQKSVEVQSELFYKEPDLKEACLMLSSMEAVDQKIRSDLSDTSGIFLKKAKYIDEVNEMCLKNILKIFSFKDFKKQSSKCYNDAWIIVQHSQDLLFQKKVLSELEINTDKFALLYDRVQINSGLQQKYGTQFDYNKQTGEIKLKPIQSLKKIDIYRKECGLEPIKIYLEKSKKMYLSLLKKQ
ncbi:MAG: hypothetical protein HEEMFOPI_01431 [Holosporales bacterium]